MADYVVLGKRRSALLVLGVFPGDDGTLAAAAKTAALAAGKAEAAWYTTVTGYAAENTDGSAVDNFVQASTNTTAGAPALNPGTPPTG